MAKFCHYAGKPVDSRSVVLFFVYVILGFCALDVLYYRCDSLFVPLLQRFCVVVVVIVVVVCAGRLETRLLPMLLRR